MKLSILIPSLTSRSSQLVDLKGELFRQMIDCKAEDELEIITEVDNRELSIGAKRNILLRKATGDYLCFHDDDDIPSLSYVRQIINAIKSNPDCCSLTGVMTWDGGDPELFEHSIKYSEYRTTNNPIKYERYPNHLNAIKSIIAKKFNFPEINHGEDTDWARQIYNSGLLKKEAEIKGVLYHYNYKTEK